LVKIDHLAISAKAVHLVTLVKVVHLVTLVRCVLHLVTLVKIDHLAISAKVVHLVTLVRAVHHAISVKAAHLVTLPKVVHHVTSAKVVHLVTLVKVAHRVNSETLAIVTMIEISAAFDLERHHRVKTAMLVIALPNNHVDRMTIGVVEKRKRKPVKRNLADLLNRKLMTLNGVQCKKNVDQKTLPTFVRRSDTLIS